MSFDTYNDNNEDSKDKSPYGPPAGHAQGQGGNPDAGWGPAQPQSNQQPNPYGMPPVAPHNAPQNPYGFPAPQPQQSYPFAGPSAPTSQAPQNAPSNPYDFNQAQQPASAKKPFLFGLTWEKNIVPNPLTNGMPPASQKSAGLAYVLWFFLGWLGVHQFYLGNNSRGLFNILVYVVAVIIGTMVSGGLLSLIYLAYWIYEAVTLNDQTNEINQGFIRKSIL